MRESTQINSIIEIYDKKCLLVTRMDENKTDTEEDYFANGFPIGRCFFKICSEDSESMINYELFYNIRC